MANWTAFTVGGYDPIMSALEGHNNREMARWNARQNYDYYIRSLKESPKAQREGLEAAGYNPLLSVMNGSLPSAFSSGVDAAPISSPENYGPDDPYVWSKHRAEARQAQNESKLLANEVKVSNAETKERVASAKLNKEYADMELEAITDDDHDVLVDGQSIMPTRKEYRQMIRNGIEQRRYRDSREHSISDDVGDWADRISSLFFRGSALRSSARQQSFDNVIRARDAREKTALRRLEWKERNRRLHRMR